MEAVFFDFDGVLGDTELLKAEAWRLGLLRFSVPAGDEFYRKRIGRRGLEIAAEAVHEFGLPEDSAELIRKVESGIYRELAETGTIPIKRNVALVIGLKAKSEMPLGVVSSQHRPILTKQIGMIGILNCFDVIISGEDFPGRGKPKPDVYLIAAERLGVVPGNCVAIEDTAIGVASAKAAGMYGLRKLSCVFFFRISPEI